MAQYGGIAFVAVADRFIFPNLGMPVPPWFQQVQQNRFGAMMLPFFVGNMIQANLQKTGAFEVYYDGKLVWSKLHSGAPPNVHKIKQALATAAAQGA